MTKTELQTKFRTHLEAVHGEKALKKFAGSELEALCISFIEYFISEKPLLAENLPADYCKYCGKAPCDRKSYFEEED